MDYSMSFLDYLNSNNKEKFAIIISRNQYAMQVGGKLTHEEMLANLISQTRKNMKIDSWGNPLDMDNSYHDDTIILLGYNGYMHIDFCDMKELNYEQYNCLSEILYYIKSYEFENPYHEKYEINVSGNPTIQLKEAQSKNVNIDNLMDELVKYTVEYCYYPNEVIIGRKLERNNDKEYEDIFNKIIDDTNYTNGFPINEKLENYTKKGYSSLVLLTLLTTILSITIFLMGIFVISS